MATSTSVMQRSELIRAIDNAYSAIRELEYQTESIATADTNEEDSQTIVSLLNFLRESSLTVIGFKTIVTGTVIGPKAVLTGKPFAE